jgi:dihydroorotase
MNTLWIRNGRIIDPSNDRDEVGDVFVRSDVIVDTLTPDEKTASTIIDATGLIVCPGLIDIHVHLREPGQTHKETIATGSRAAAAGGFTTIVCMPNTNPPADNPGTIRQIQDAILKDAIVHVYPTGCITRGMEGAQMAPIGSLKNAGVVAITDDGKCVQNNEIMRRALEYARMFNLPIMDHCQDYALTENAVINEGSTSLQLGVKGWPNAAEDIIVSRNIILSHYSGAHIHMQHISSAYSVELMRMAKKQGIRVTAEATPHHIYFTDEMLKGYDTHFKMNPPLRTEADRVALIEGLIDGTLDCLATDHAPHTQHEKDCELDKAPFGIIGLETALAASLEILYHSGKLSLLECISLWTNKAAKIVNMPIGTLSVGRTADITLIDPEATTTVTRPFQSRSSNSPWIGKTLRGRISRTIVSGKSVWVN